MRNPNSKTLVVLVSADSAELCVKAIKNCVFDEDSSIGIDENGATIDYEYSDEACESLNQYFKSSFSDEELVLGVAVAVTHLESVSLQRRKLQ